MKKTSVRSLCRTTDTASVTFPVYLLVAVIIATMVFTIIAFGTSHLISDWNFQQVKKTIDSITYQAETLAAYTKNGSIQTISISFPSEVCCVVFGGKTNLGNTTAFIRNENITNLIYVLMKNGQEYYAYSSVPFMGLTVDSCAVLPPGSYVITLSLQENGDETYVKITL